MKRVNIVIGAFLIVLAPLIVLSATVYTLMLPNIYASSVKLAVKPENGSCENPCAHCSYVSSAFVHTQIEVLKSKPILYETVKRLDLQREWGIRGDRLPGEVAYKILRNAVRISVKRDSQVFVISVHRDNPVEAADIANELAVVYRDVQEKQASNGKESVVVQLIDIAEPNRRPVSPNLFMNILIAVVLGSIFLTVGTGLVLLGAKSEKRHS